MYNFSQHTMQSLKAAIVSMSNGYGIYNNIVQGGLWYFVERNATERNATSRGGHSGSPTTF